MIRPTSAGETASLQAIARETRFFRSMEITALGEVLDDYHAAAHRVGDRAVTLEQEGRPVGFAYFAPTPMTDRTWHLYWLFVEKGLQGCGFGSQLLRYAEDEIIAAKGRLLLIETSSLPFYEPTRRFYRKHGYEQAAVIADFYVDGDDQVIFHKRLAASENLSTPMG